MKWFTARPTTKIALDGDRESNKRRLKSTEKRNREWWRKREGILKRERGGTEKRERVLKREREH
jgi:hypothetical protein